VKPQNPIHALRSSKGSAWRLDTRAPPPQKRHPTATNGSAHLHCFSKTKVDENSFPSALIWLALAPISRYSIAGPVGNPASISGCVFSRNWIGRNRPRGPLSSGTLRRFNSMHHKGSCARIPQIWNLAGIAKCLGSS